MSVTRVKIASLKIHGVEMKGHTVLELNDRFNPAMERIRDRLAQFACKIEATNWSYKRFMEAMRGWQPPIKKRNKRLHKKLFGSE